MARTSGMNGARPYACDINLLTNWYFDLRRVPPLSERVSDADVWMNATDAI